ncbi:MAG: mechanosensitive ion channel [Promethearchaeota archaeon]|nr:MAG: mechanosensitive ion channel [Candidatus Lokiarchaeota archaeon]
MTQWLGIISITGIIWVDILILVAAIIGTYIIYKIVLYLIKRSARLGNIPPDVINGVKMVVRLISAIVIIILIINFIQLPSEITLAISAIIGSAVGFGSIQAVQNFISGLYIIITHPFGIGNLLAIGDNEGIVTEISLNYTKVLNPAGERIMISNRNVLNSNIINHTIEVEKEKGKQKDKKSIIDLKSISKIIIGEEITRYVFYLELPRDNPDRLMKILDETANDWESEFDGNKPQFILSNLTNFAIYGIVLISEKPETILKKRPLFVKDIYRRIFKK